MALVTVIVFMLALVAQRLVCPTSVGGHAVSGPGVPAAARRPPPITSIRATGAPYRAAGREVVPKIGSAIRRYSRPMADARLAGTQIADSVIDLIGRHAARADEAHDGDRAAPGRAGDEDGDHQPRRLVEGSTGARDDPRRRARAGSCSRVARSSSRPAATPASAWRSSPPSAATTCVFVMTDKVAPEKISLLQAYGAEVVVCPVAVAPDDPRSYYRSPSG